MYLKGDFIKYSLILLLIFLYVNVAIVNKTGKIATVCECCEDQKRMRIARAPANETLADEDTKTSNKDRLLNIR